ncbi:hypothetical protein AWZ03_009752 [Drosophila navojoa]|uniref:Uncharacterized protein n=1 Tax=Drosophila navojoa TaxID=7232 RepID=A0A484B7L7_DRONA|nr:hypothetical protein AWZ03_009752 [Drosophila navojoa]
MQKQKRSRRGRTIDYNILGRGKKPHEQQRQHQQPAAAASAAAGAGYTGPAGRGMRLGGMRVVSGLMAACQQQQQKQHRQQQQQQHRQLQQPTTASDHQPNSFRLLTASEQQASCSTGRERENERRCCRVAGSWSRSCTMPNTRAERTKLQQQQQQQPQQQKQQQQPQQKSLHSMHKHAHTHARTYTRYQLNRADK